MGQQQKPGTRRAFLSGALTTLAGAQAVAAGSLSKPVSTETPDDDAAAQTLRSLAEIVLPSSDLGDEGVTTQVEAFERWAAGFEPVAELDHPYLSSDELRYGPPDPRPNWRAQLQALDTEANHRWARRFFELEPGRQLQLVEQHLDRLVPPAPAAAANATAESPAALPFPFAAEAPHVAIALLAWFTGTSLANDLCYDAAIGRHECRGLPGAVNRPAVLPSARPVPTREGAP